MRHRFVPVIGAVAVATFLGGLVPAPVAGQVPAGLTKVVPDPDVPRTPDGKPDLTGFWNTATLTPLERPAKSGEATLTEEQARAIEVGAANVRERRALASDPNRVHPPFGGDGSTGAAGGVGGYNNFWIDNGTDVIIVNGQRRAALIVDPPDGRVPALTDGARQRNAGRRGTAQRPTSDAQENEGGQGLGVYDDFELRPLGERCLIGFGSTSGPPALPVLYNNIKQIVQTPDHVMILNEMVHDVRAVRLNSQHLPKTIRNWLGDSIGWWDGDTLVVETTNFTDKTRFRGSSPELKVTERFTRVNQTTLLYQFTVDDPSTWTRAWSGEYPWIRSDEPVYEYACHEANYAMQGILKGARIMEAAGAKNTPW